jgi:hypothetical protein
VEMEMEMGIRDNIENEIEHEEMMEMETNKEMMMDEIKMKMRKNSTE